MGRKGLLPPARALYNWTLTSARALPPKPSLNVKMKPRVVLSRVEEEMELLRLQPQLRCLRIAKTLSAPWPKGPGTAGLLHRCEASILPCHSQGSWQGNGSGPLAFDSCLPRGPRGPRARRENIRSCLDLGRGRGGRVRTATCNIPSCMEKTSVSGSTGCWVTLEGPREAEEAGARAKSRTLQEHREREGERESVCVCVCVCVCVGGGVLESWRRVVMHRAARASDSGSWAGRPSREAKTSLVPAAALCVLRASC